MLEISIHALLAESDDRAQRRHRPRRNFNPRSPCGERLERYSNASRLVLFQSTLSLRRATASDAESAATEAISIHALLAESDSCPKRIRHCNQISIHALLAESDWMQELLLVRRSISIHALLAESDADSFWGLLRFIQFQSTLSLRRATPIFISIYSRWDFNPRSPCGERHSIRNGDFKIPELFQSTLSLRRATVFLLPCTRSNPISIHALLAESDPTSRTMISRLDDFNPRSPCGERPHGLSSSRNSWHFNPRSPCGERRWVPRPPVARPEFQSTLSLRRATRNIGISSRTCRFQSTLSLRRATGGAER